MAIPHRVSVALCTCNGSPFIARQIESICEQTLPAHEIVLHDDASDDDTVERARKQWERCKERRPDATPQLRIRVNSPRLGVAQNFASALRECEGDLIALCDQDDVWHPQRLQKLVTRLDANPDTLLLHGNARLVDAQGQPLGKTLFDALAVSRSELDAIRKGRAFGVFLDRNLVTGATTIFRRQLLDAAFPFPTHWLHDEWLGVLAAVLGKVDVAEEPLIDYRQHGANQVGARSESLLEAFHRASQPRADWHTKRLIRAQQLQARLVALNGAVADSDVRTVKEKVAHHQWRSSLPAQRLLRPLPILKEWATGRYGRFGRGIRGVIKDLFERA